MADVGTLHTLKQRWAALPLLMRFAVIAIAIAGAGYWGVTQVMTRNPSMTVLFSNLAEEDAAQIVERLRAGNIRFQLESGVVDAFVVGVESVDHVDRLVDGTRLALAEVGYRVALA